MLVVNILLACNRLYACSPLGCVTGCVVYGRFDSKIRFEREKNDSQVPSYKQKCKVVSLNLAHPVYMLHVIEPSYITVIA